MANTQRTRAATFVSLLLAVGACLLPGSSFGDERYLPLFRAIDERLAYMEDVALFKAQNGAPIEDLAREQIVLSDAKRLAASRGLKPESMESFFQAQMNAAKAIQYRHRADLLIRKLPEQSINLASELRPALDRLGDAIVELFATLLSRPAAIEEEHRELFMDTLQRRWLTTADEDALFNAMLKVRLDQ